MTSRPPRIFDRSAIARARARAEHSRGDQFLVRHAGEGLIERILPINRAFRHALDIDPFGESAAILSRLSTCWSVARFDHGERLVHSGSDFDLSTSVLGLHSIDDVPGALVQIRKLLVPDGVFAAALLGGSTLHELRESLTTAEVTVTGGASPRVAPFADVRDIGNLMQRAGFALPVADVERTTILYRSFDHLVRDLRANAQTNTLTSRSHRPLSKQQRHETIVHYRQHHAEPDGRLRATFDVIYVVAFAPAASQPEPLKPGSAKHRLASALGTKEIPL